MCRVGREVRIFPLLNYNAERSSYLDRVISFLEADEFPVEIEKVSYEFQKGGNEMLRIRSAGK
jgi:hypothetical protein